MRRVAILETIAVSMVSLAALVLTITMVVVQLAMGQFSPRIVQTFLQDRPSQLAIGLFVATFAHAMLAMREVQFDGDGQVPGVAIVVAYVLVLTSIAMLVLYVHHIGRSLRVSALIELVGTDTRRLLDRHYPRALTPAKRAATDVIAAPKSGVLIGVDHDAAGRAGDARRLRAARRSRPRRVRPRRRAAGADRGRPPAASTGEAVTDALRSGSGTHAGRRPRLRLPHAGRHGRTVAVRLAVPRSDHRGAVHRPAP